MSITYSIITKRPDFKGIETRIGFSRIRFSRIGLRRDPILRGLKQNPVEHSHVAIFIKLRRDPILRGLKQDLSADGERRRLPITKRPDFKGIETHSNVSTKLRVMYYEETRF